MSQLSLFDSLSQSSHTSVESIKEDFLHYLGGENDLRGYQKSYKLVFYKCFFELLDHGREVEAELLTNNFQRYYIARKQLGLVPDHAVDRVIEDIENSSTRSVYNLILRNPYNAIEGRGFIEKFSRDGQDFFALTPALRETLSAQDIQDILEIVYKKLIYYFSRIDEQDDGDESMFQIVTRILNEYTEAKTQRFSGHPLGNFFRREIKDKLEELALINPDTHLVAGSVGQGGWANIPWICIFDRNITETAQKGVYIVYLLSADGETLYLTLNQGCTDIRNTHSKSETIQILQDTALQIRSLVKSRGFLSDGEVNLGDNLPDLALYYEKGTIFYKAYHKGEVPPENVLREDLKNMLAVYADYAATLKEPKVEKKAYLLTWNPNNWDWYDFFDAVATTRAGKLYSGSWSSINSNIEVGDRLFLTMLGTERNGIIASGYATSASFKDEHWDSERAAEGKYARYIDMDFDWLIDYTKHSPLLQTQLEEQFPEQKWNPQGSGIIIKEKYIDELEALWADLRKGGTPPMSTLDTLAHIKAFIAARGFSYNDGLVENFYLSIKSKPFTLLAGTSGTGKTRLVKLFAEAVGATVNNGRYKLVAVRPDWSDSSDLFGHVDLNGRFIPGAIIDFVHQASLDLNAPYFLCLDEMNLARVEYYLSDVLSIIETREFQGDRIVSHPLLEKTYFGADEVAAERYDSLHLPENLYIVGTVNMDETTFPFSRKVLDRANTIEFSYVDLMPQDSGDRFAVPALDLPNHFLRAEYLLLTHCGDDSNAVERYCAKLQEINEVLAKANAHVGYRVRDEIVFYMLHNQKAELLSENEAFDNQIMQKILPRIQGSSASIKAVLVELFKLCMGNFQGLQTMDANLSDVMQQAANSSQCKYAKSAQKIAFMVRRYEEDGFTSYWL